MGGGVITQILNDNLDQVRVLWDSGSAQVRPLHPTPYTLHPTPYTLHPTPYTPHPTPYIRQDPRPAESRLIHPLALGGGPNCDLKLKFKS